MFLSLEYPSMSASRRTSLALSRIQLLSFLRIVLLQAKPREAVYYKMTQWVAGKPQAPGACVIAFSETPRNGERQSLP